MALVVGSPVCSTTHIQKCTHAYVYEQVREPLNSGVAIMKGVWDPSFIGESQHATATHVVPHEATTHAQALQILRRDIQR